MSTVASRTGVGSRLALTATVLASLAAALASIRLNDRWLWLDELLSANLASHGPWAALVTVLRFDVHPPLYYAQLSLWMLVSRSDPWLMANSILWFAAAVALLTFGATRLHGHRVGYATGFLLALSPAAITYADQVRMYALLMFLVVWAWYAQARWLEAKAGRYGAVWVILSQAAVTNSHTAGLIMISGCVLCGAVTAARNGRGLFLRWLLAEMLVGVVSLPAIVIGAMRGVTHLRAPGLTDVLATWGFLAGHGVAPGYVGLLLEFLVLALLAFGCWQNPRLILSVVTLVFAPIFLAALVSLLVKPMWIERVFVPVIPFLCLCLARSALEIPSASQIPAKALLALMAVWSAITIGGQFIRQKGDGFRPAAEVVRQLARPDDIVLVDGDYDYWCFMWYFAGPDWGDPRQAFLVNPDWERMMRHLPAQVVSLLDLGNADVSRHVDGNLVALWDPRLPPPAASGDIFLLRAQAATPVAIAGRKRDATIPLMQLVLERWVRTP